MDILILYFCTGLLLSGAMLAVRSRVVQHALLFPFLFLQVVLTANEAYKILGNDTPHFIIDFYNEWLRPLNKLADIEKYYFQTDAVGFIFLVVLTVVSIAVALQSVSYQTFRKDPSKRIGVHNASFTMLVVSMSGVLLTRHIGLIWAFLEATTICASMLIFHERTRKALEAAWKYIFVCSIAIALAFVGILFLGIAAKGNAELDFSFDALLKNAVGMESIWLKMTYLLAIVGYSAKMGLMPFFNVDIDAKDAAPSHVGALLSGGLMNVGFVAIFRFYQVFSQTAILEWMNHVNILVGLSSLFFAAVYINKIYNIKRVLAYSSLEHAGIALVAVGLGAPHIAIVHLMLHSLVKAALFIQVDQVERYRLLHTDARPKGYFGIHPTGALVLITGFAAISALPPSAMFITEYMLLGAFFTQGNVGFDNMNWVLFAAAIMLLLLLTIIFFGMARVIFHLVLGKGTPAPRHYLKKRETIVPGILLLVVFILGIYMPQGLWSFIESSVAFIPK